MENMKLKFNAIIETIHLATGEVTKTTKVHNMVMNTGKDEVAHLIGGISTPVAFTRLAIGTTNTAVANSQTALFAEVKRASVTPTDTGIGVILYDHTFTFGTGESYTIVEYGLFNDPTVGVMLNRLVDAGHAVDIDNGLRVRITITVA